MVNNFNTVAFTLTILLTSSGCSTDAEVASRNLSKAAEMFEIERRILFYDAIQGDFLLSIEGRCSMEIESGILAVTCRVGRDSYKKHYLGLSDNVTFFSEQLADAKVSTYRYRVVLKPEALLLDVDLSTSAAPRIETEQEGER